MTEPVEILRQKNIKVLSTRFPSLSPHLNASYDTAGIPVRDENGYVVDISFDDNRLYGENGRDWSKRQIEEYLAEPDRLALHKIAYCNISQAIFPIVNGIADFLRENDIKLTVETTRDIGYFFGVGLGLGFYLQDILERNIARTIVIVENHPLFLQLSLEAIDWGLLFEIAEKNKIDLSLHLLSSPEEMRNIVDSKIGQHTNIMLDGSYSFGHYYSWFTKSCKEIIIDQVKVHSLSQGFYEDEIIMIRNTYMNLSQYECRIIDTKKKIAQSVPAFIVASGPSLDESLPVVKKWRDRAVVCSCGTAFGILLKNGIVPDFHVEHENTWPLVENLTRLKKDVGSFHDVTLLASTTVRPETSALFNERWFFYRGALSSAYLTRDERYETLPSSAPMNANAASACLLNMGFKELYLFGVDCGQREGQAHHSKLSPYFEEGHHLAHRTIDDTGVLHGRTIRAPANFGGHALTSWALYTSADTLAALFSWHQATIYNCSDGVRIEHTIPKSPHAVSLDSTPSGAYTLVKQRIRAQLMSHAPGDLLTGIPFQSYVRGVARFREAISEFIKILQRPNLDTSAAVQELLDTMKKRKDAIAGYQITYSCILSMLRLAAMGGNRITDNAIRDKFFFHISTLIEKQIDAFTEKLSLFYQQLAEGVPVLDENDFFVFLPSDSPSDEMPSDTVSPASCPE